MAVMKVAVLESPEAISIEDALDKQGHETFKKLPGMYDFIDDCLAWKEHTLLRKRKHCLKHHRRQPAPSEVFSKPESPRC